MTSPEETSEGKDGLLGLSKDQISIVRSAFDAEFYLSKNPDLARRGVDPFVHYMERGWREGRNPSKQFQTLDYLKGDRDLLRSGANPFVHWLLPTVTRNAEPDAVPAEGSGVSAAPAAIVPSPVVDERGGADGVAVAPVERPKLFAPREARKRAKIQKERESRVTYTAADLEKLYATSGLEPLNKQQVSRVRGAFDADHYKRENPDVAALGLDPFLHYMTVGWKERRDPSPDFSTDFYLKYYKDINDSGINPFIHWVLHGIDETRQGVSFRRKLDNKEFTPTIVAIVPNYNHAKFLKQRIDSILAQTYPHITITILDDCSSDSSRSVIDEYVAMYPKIITAIYNSVNSGSVFKQWRKGVESTTSDLVWICESDDFCEPDFIENLVPHFADDSVNIAFGRITETDSEGNPNPSLDDYRETAEPGIWDDALIRPAAAWFAKGFGVSNVIANVGGCLWRRAMLPDAVWEEAQTYRVVGDWYLYLAIASGGQIAWEPEAISYFRRHEASTSGNSFDGTRFYSELERFMLTLRSTWDVPDDTVRRFHEIIVRQYKKFDVAAKVGPLEDYCNLDKLLATKRSRPHVLIAMYGFVPGGGENFPIYLANSLVEKGWLVSMLIFEARKVNAYMRNALDSSVAVYDATWIVEYGADQFLADAGISLVHSHTVGAEMHFYNLWRIRHDVRFVVTLHGSYEASELPTEMIRTIATPVDHFVYTADKNLAPLDGLAIPAERFTKLPNAMPIDPAAFPKTRAEMGIAEDAVVFTLVARGIIRKGWRAAIGAFIELRKRNRGRAVHLCLVGEGDVPDELAEIHGRDPDISFLGYQSHINGLYRLTDVAIVPTRFSGESFPLCIIQALQVGTPVVASDVGEIPTMLTGADGTQGGITIEAVRDTKQFTRNLRQAMEQMLDYQIRMRYAAGARQLGDLYDMDKLVGVYEGLYNRVLDMPSVASKLRATNLTLN